MFYFNHWLLLLFGTERRSLAISKLSIDILSLSNDNVEPWGTGELAAIFGCKLLWFFFK